MIDRREILETATRMSLRPHVVEKDYVLGWMLAGIGAHPALSDNWLFKGGTCLNKVLLRDLSLLRGSRLHPD